MCTHNKFLNNGLVEAYETVYSYKTPVNNILILLNVSYLGANPREMGGTCRWAGCN